MLMGLRRNLRTRWLLAASLSVILVATLYPAGSTNAPSSSFCLLCGTYGLADVMRNVILFVPWGFALASRGRGSAAAVFLSVVLSGSVELAQVLLVPGRDGNPVDVVSNTVGAVLGWGAFASIGFWLDPPPRRSAALAAAALAAAASTLMISALLLEPDPPEGTYFGQWTPEFAGVEVYQGRVLNASVGQLIVRDGPVAASASLRHQIRRRETIRVEAVAGPPPVRIAPLFNIYDDHQREVLFVGIEGVDLIFRYRTRAATARLHQPSHHVPAMFDDIATGGPFALTLRWNEGGYCVAVNAREHCGVRWSADRGWSFLHYSRYLDGRPARFLDFVWIALLFAPAGYWLTASHRLRESARVIATTLLLAVLILALVSSVSYLTLVAATAGPAIGGALRAFARAPG
jgi:VanZ family protein